MLKAQLAGHIKKLQKLQGLLDTLEKSPHDENIAGQVDQLVLEFADDQLVLVESLIDFRIKFPTGENNGQ